MESLKLFKIGGSIVNNAVALESFLDAFEEVPHPKVLVHGGGNAASDLCEKLGIPIQMNEGRRITDKPALDVAVMVYAGLLNKNIVAQLQARSCNALGLTGADLNIIPARKRRHPAVDFGFVGEIKADAINSYFIRRLLDEQIVPVFPAITHDGKGQLFNTNADTIAASLAIALSDYYEVTLTYIFSKNGVLEDINDDDSWIPTLSSERFSQMQRAGTILEGMIPKLETGFDALRQNVKSVQIKHAQNLTNNVGTMLSL